MGRRLGQVQKAQGTRGACPFSLFLSLPFPDCLRFVNQALLATPPHPNIIPLYNSFLLPESKELYFVFEPMEGHLYQLIKSCHGRRPFASGLVESIFRQIVET